MALNKAAWLRLAAGLLLSSIMMAGLFIWLDQQNADWTMLSKTPPAAWVALVACLLASYLLRSARVHSELSRIQTVQKSSVLMITLTHNAAVNLMPMRTGELAYPLLLKRELGIEVKNSIPSLAWMRLQDMVVLGVIFTLLMPGLTWWLKCLLLTVGIVLLQSLLRLLRQGFVRLPRIASHFFEALMSSEKHAAVTWVYCSGNWTIKLLGVGMFLVLAADIHTTAAMTAALAGELSALLPVQGPANLGSYEAAVWGTIHATHATYPVMLPLLILAMHAAMVSLALTAGLIGWVCLRKK